MQVYSVAFFFLIPSTDSCFTASLSRQSKNLEDSVSIWGVILIMYSKEDGALSRRIKIETASESFWEVEILEISGNCKI